MKGFLFFLLLVALILVVVSLLSDGKSDREQQGAAQEERAERIPPSTALPVQLALSAGSESYVVIRGRTVRFGVSLISAPPDTTEAGLVVSWVQLPEQKPWTIRLSTDDDDPVGVGPASIRLVGLEKMPQEESLGRGSYRAILEVDSARP